MADQGGARLSGRKGEQNGQRLASKAGKEETEPLRGGGGGGVHAGIADRKKKWTVGKLGGSVLCTGGGLHTQDRQKKAEGGAGRSETSRRGEPKEQR